jgi:hypothetical protein
VPYKVNVHTRRSGLIISYVKFTYRSMMWGLDASGRRRDVLSCSNQLRNAHGPPTPIGGLDPEDLRGG